MHGPSTTPAWRQVPGSGPGDNRGPLLFLRIHSATDWLRPFISAALGDSVLEADMEEGLREKATAVNSCLKVPVTQAVLTTVYNAPPHTAQVKTLF